MRTAFLQTLTEVAERDERVWLLCGDLGYSVLEPFLSRFPDRFLNVGVAEQNMTGLAAGLALCGKIVFTYSIGNFPTMRCLEQIRNDVCYHELNVKVVAVGGGLAYGPQGYTHHSVEDLAIMKAMPNMTVIAPGDPAETRAATRAIVDWPGPCYLRLGKAGEPAVHAQEPDFAVGRAIEVLAGTDLTLISTGGMLETTVKAGQRLQDRGISTQVLSLHTLAPLDEDAILGAAGRTGRIVTVEEHGPGGLGSAVAEVVAHAGCGARLRAVRLDAKPIRMAGSQNVLRTAQGLSTESIVAAALAIL